MGWRVWVTIMTLCPWTWGTQLQGEQLGALTASVSEDGDENGDVGRALIQELDVPCKGACSEEASPTAGKNERLSLTMWAPAVAGDAGSAWLSERHTTIEVLTDKRCVREGGGDPGSRKRRVSVRHGDVEPVHVVRDAVDRCGDAFVFISTPLVPAAQPDDWRLRGPGLREGLVPAAW